MSPLVLGIAGLIVIVIIFLVYTHATDRSGELPPAVRIPPPVWTPPVVKAPVVKAPVVRVPPPDYVKWTTEHSSDPEMRSKLNGGANYRCCSNGYWVCTGGGCGGAAGGSAAAVTKCGPVTKEMDAIFKNICSY